MEPAPLPPWSRSAQQQEENTRLGLSNQITHLLFSSCGKTSAGQHLLALALFHSVTDILPGGWRFGTDSIVHLWLSISDNKEDDDGYFNSRNKYTAHAPAVGSSLYNSRGLKGPYSPRAQPATHSAIQPVSGARGQCDRLNSPTPHNKPQQLPTAGSERLA